METLLHNITRFKCHKVWPIFTRAEKSPQYTCHEVTGNLKIYHAPILANSLLWCCELQMSENLLARNVKSYSQFVPLITKKCTMHWWRDPLKFMQKTNNKKPTKKQPETTKNLHFSKTTKIIPCVDINKPNNTIGKQNKPKKTILLPQYCFIRDQQYHLALQIKLCVQFTKMLRVLHNHLKVPIPNLLM